MCYLQKQRKTIKYLHSKKYYFRDATGSSCQLTENKFMLFNVFRGGLGLSNLGKNPDQFL